MITYMPLGERVYLPGTQGPQHAHNLAGVIEGYATMTGTGGTHFYYVVQLDQRDQDWLGTERTYVSNILVHPDNIKAGDGR